MGEGSTSIVLCFKLIQLYKMSPKLWEGKIPSLLRFISNVKANFASHDEIRIVYEAVKTLTFLLRNSCTLSVFLNKIVSFELINYELFNCKI